MAPNRTGAPTLPVDISQSPLLSGSLLPDALLSTLAGPLPTITIGLYLGPPASPRLQTRPFGALRSPGRAHGKPLSKPSSPRTPSSPIPPKQIDSLYDLLETMEHDVATEVQRVRLGIQETRMLVRACREDTEAREVQRLRKMGYPRR